MDDDDDEGTDWIDAALKSGMGFKSPEERQAYIDSIGDPLEHPMFATSTDELANHPLTEAFRVLRDEDKSNEELAIMYKDEGNQWLKKGTTKSAHEAYDRYTHAYNLLDKDPVIVNEETNQLRSQILSNRAQSSMFVRNFGFCRDDSNEALKWWPENIKAHFRKCKALISLRKYKDCQDACTIALNYDPSNAEILKLQEQCQKEITRLAAARALEAAKIETLKSKWALIWKLTQLLNIRVSVVDEARPTQLKQFWPHVGVSPATNSSEDDSQQLQALTAMTARMQSLQQSQLASVTASLHWPVVLLYPEHGKLDIIESACSADMLVAHLAAAFPEPDDSLTGDSPPHGWVSWDSNHEYKVSALVAYIVAGVNYPVESEDAWIQSSLIQYNKLNKTSDVDDDDDASASALPCPPPSQPVQSSSSLAAVTPQILTKVLIEVHLGCSLLAILSAPGHVLGNALLKLIVFVRDNNAHKQFMRQHIRNGFALKQLTPTGQLAPLTNSKDRTKLT